MASVTFGDTPVDLEALRAKWESLGQSTVEKATDVLQAHILDGPGVVETVRDGIKKAEKIVQDAYVYLESAPELEGLPDDIRQNASKNLKSLMEKLQTLNSNWEKMVAYLQLDTDETAQELALVRLETEQDTLETQSKDKSNKIEKNLDAMEKAARNKTLMIVFGWVMAVIVLAAAVVTAGTALAAVGAAAAGAAAAGGVAAGGATAGAAAGGAAAAATTTAATTTASFSTVKVVSLCVSAALTITSQSLETSGDMERLQKKLASKLRDQGVEKADLAAQLIIGVGTAVAIAGTGMAGQGQFMLALSQIGSQALRFAMIASETVISATVLTQQGFSVKSSYDQSMADAAVKEAEAMLQLVQQMMDETQEELNEIMDKILNLLGQQIAKLIDHALESREEIANNIKVMS